MPFYYVQDICQKNQLGTRCNKRISDYDTGEGGMEVGIPLLSYSKNNITADKVFLFLVFKLEV